MFLSKMGIKILNFEVQKFSLKFQMWNANNAVIILARLKAFTIIADVADRILIFAIKFEALKCTLKSDSNKTYL